MRRIDEEVQTLLKEYGGDVKQILRENARLDLLYALSPQRELLLEWYDFKPGARLLEVGAGCGAMTGLFAGCVSAVTVLDEDEQALNTVRLRYPKAANIRCEKNSLTGLASGCARKNIRYDYVVFAGTLTRPYEENIAAAKSLLSPGGVLIVAAANPLGMKFLAGSRPQENALTKKQLAQLLTGTSCEQPCQAPAAEAEASGTRPAEAGALTFYYPMPDWRTPVSIYSDRYLPKKGDLTKVTPAYDYPPYHMIDMGEKFDAVCEAGAFDICANAYLVFWSADAGASDPPYLYIKYNKTRREPFQIKTCICENDRGRYALKEALSLDSAAHISSFPEKYEALLRQHPRLTAAKPAPVEGRNAVSFPYLAGGTWAEKLGRAIVDGALPEAALKEALGVILDVPADLRTAFVPTEEFAEIFGGGFTQEDYALLAGETSLRTSNIDILLENLVLTDGCICCLDYEWVFFFPVPESFIRYRILYYFYEQYASILGRREAGEFLSAFGISPALAALCARMEVSFQNYVHGENQALYLGNYMVYSRGVREIRQTESDLSRARERIEQMKIHSREKDVTIRKITEIQRLTNNHVTNLEAIIRDLRHEISEQAKTLAYLDRHEAILFRIRRKLGDAFNRKYPKGSPQRKLLSYRKEYLLHPVRSIRLYSTPEGRNLRDGDFHIGSIYREHGKLHFSRPGNPAVSIIIPVYNQIAYTYACLLSILEHTRDISYEVVIADDVSTDATARLGDFAEGLVICRNSSNQGFLRNCNNAARQARGRYLMFLNNDTQVTPGWLSSLVNLIESDPAIGMVGSKLVYPDGRLQEAGGIIWSDGSGWNYGRLDDPDKPEYNYVKDVDYISGAAILLSAALWKQIGGFDTRFAPAYCEDSDLAFAVREAGYRVVYQPLSKVIHYEGVSNGTDVEGTGLKRYQAVNVKKLKEKWAARLAEQCENNGNPDPFRARERSQGKKIILVVDHYVPTYDKDAGSKTTFQYLKMFLHRGYVVKFLGDNFMHEEPYTTVLEQMGIEVLYGPEYQGKIWDWFREHGDDISVAYLNRPHIASKYIDYLLDNTDMKVIYYGHDLHFLRETREYRLTGDPKAKENAQYWQYVETTLMSKAAVSYFPSFVERDAVLELDPTITVRDITAYVYEDFKEDIEEDFAKRSGLLFVGGFGHPPNGDAVKWFVGEVWPLIRSQLREAGVGPQVFTVVGSQVTEEIAALDSPEGGIRIRGFVTEEELSALYASCRVVVVPLRYGAGVKGKVVEALYNGAPVVTTSIGAEGLYEAGEVMAVADGAEAFAGEVVRLCMDDAACADLSRKTQAYVRRYFSEDAAWRRIEEDFA